MHLVIGSILLIFGALVPVSSMAAQVKPLADHVQVDVKGVSLVHVVKDTNGVVRVSLQGPRKDKKATPPHHLYLVIDISASMQEKNRITAVRHALLKLNEYLQENAPDLPLSLITFNGEAKEFLPQKTSEEKLTSFSQIQPEGGTDFHPPVKLLKDIIDKSSAIPLAILLTDGESNTLNSQTFAPLKGFQVELVGVGAKSDISTLGHVAESLNTGLHYLLDDAKVLSVSSSEHSMLGQLLQLHLSRIKDVVVGSVSIKAHIPEGSDAKFIGSSLGAQVISPDGRHIEVTIPSLADEEKKEVDFYVKGVLNGEISVNVASKQVEFVTQKIDDFISDLGAMNTCEVVFKKLIALSDNLNQKYPVLKYDDLIFVQEELAGLIGGFFGKTMDTPQFKSAMSPEKREELERTMTSIRYKYAGSIMKPKELHLEQDPVFEKTLHAHDALQKKTEILRQAINQSTSNDGLAQALKAFMSGLQQDANHDLVAELLSAVDEMAKEFKIAAENGIVLEEAKRFLLASIHNGAHNRVSNTPGASQGTKAQKSFKEKFLDNAKIALIGAGKDAVAVEAFGSLVSALSTKSALKPVSVRMTPATTSQQPPEGNGSSFSIPALRSVSARNAPAANAPSTTAEQAPAGFTTSRSVNDIRSKFEKKQ